MQDDGQSRSSSTPACSGVPRALVDYARITFQECELEDVMALFGLPEHEWTRLDCGGRFYQKQVRRQHVRILFDGAQPGMGVHVDLSGQACRQLEHEGVIPNGDWEGFLRLCLGAGGKFTRIDFAFDDQEGRLPFEAMVDHYRAGHYVSRSRKDRLEQELDKRSGLLGSTLYFGSRQSETVIRIYDKRAEQIAKHPNRDAAELPAAWTRVELEFHDKRSQAAAALIAGGAWDQVLGVLRAYLEFKVPSATNPQKTRWQACDWWLEWLAWMEKSKLDIEPVLRTLEKCAEWLGRQAAPAIALILAAEGYGQEFLDALIEDGFKRWKSFHWRAIGMEPPGAGEFGVAGGA